MNNKENSLTNLSVAESELTITNYNKSDDNKYFPFQTQTQLDLTPESCPVQKRFKKLGATRKSLANVVEKLNQRLITLYPRQSEHAKKEIQVLKNNLQFLETNKSFVFQFAKTYLEPRTYDFLHNKNLNMLSGKTPLSHLKNVRSLTVSTAVYFYPNLLDYYTAGIFNGGNPRLLKRKSSSKKLVINTLKFFFVDIDNAVSFDDVELKIKKFGLEPDIIVQTSENGFHLYWSIESMSLDTVTEDKRGHQFDANLILYELGLKSLIAEFQADEHRSNASSLMRMPETWNIKKSKKRKFRTRYLENSRTLAEAVRAPKYKFNEIIEHISKYSNAQINAQATEQIKLKEKPSLKNENHTTKTEEQIASTVTETKQKVEFDFNANWDEALISLCKFFNIEQNHFSFNDLIVLKHMWIYRLCKKLNFPKFVRKVLKGSGEKYSELKFSIDKITSLPRKIKSRIKLVELIEQHSRAGRNKTGSLTGYKVSEMFLEACGQNKTKEKKDWLSIITNNLYIKKNRNVSMPYDCFILGKVLQFSRDEALAILIDKVNRSANQADESLSCSNDTSNIEAWLSYYYK